MNVSASQPFELSPLSAKHCSMARAGPRALNFKAFVRAVLLVLSQNRLHASSQVLFKENVQLHYCQPLRSTSCACPQVIPNRCARSKLPCWRARTPVNIYLFIAQFKAIFKSGWYICWAARTRKREAAQCRAAFTGLCCIAMKSQDHSRNLGMVSGWV